MNISPSAWIEAIEKYLGQTKGWLQMHQRVSALEKRIAALEAGKTSSGPTCDHCGSPDLARTGTRNSPGPFGALGLKEAVYRCNACGKDNHIEQPMPN